MSDVPAQGETIGIIGGGQLGRMLAMAAARLGYRTVVLEPEPDCPAAQTAGRQIVADYDDPGALAELARDCAVVTYEFENVPVEAMEALARSVPLYPPPDALRSAQDRLTEKSMLNAIGVPTARFQAVDNQEELTCALDAFSRSGIVKTRRMGYDGKGQHRFRDAPAGAETGVFAALGGVPAILEELVSFEREISVIAARSADGSVVAYDPPENLHRNGILHSSTVPAAISDATARAAREAAFAILDHLDYTGVIGVEFFVLADGSLLANEFAPRVHNSGHWTEAACAVSQFEQHIRAICGWPLAGTARHSDCQMVNLIGDDVAGLRMLAGEADAVIHLYGKTQARTGRKMGHVTRLKTLSGG